MVGVGAVEVIQLGRTISCLVTQMGHRPRYHCLLTVSSPDVLIFASLIPVSFSFLMQTWLWLQPSQEKAATLSGRHLLYPLTNPQSAKDRSPHLLNLLDTLQMFCLWSDLNKKWSTDSGSRPQNDFIRAFLRLVYYFIGLVPALQGFHCQWWIWHHIIWPTLELCDSHYSSLNKAIYGIIDYLLVFFYILKI